MAINKQDRTAARTVTDLERKYSFAKSFAEVAGFAQEARRVAEESAEEAKTYVSELFTKNILLTGKFTNSVEAYLLPGDEEIATMTDHFVGPEIIPAERIPLYDFDGDGRVTTQDILLARRYRNGIEDFANWSGAVKSVVTMTIDLSDPTRAIRFVGTNMWGRAVESYVGIDFTNIVNRDTEDKISDLELRIDALESQLAAMTAVTNVGGE
jgi:hypothetical protein